jgi:hypothetical protein
MFLVALRRNLTESSPTDCEAGNQVYRNRIIYWNYIIKELRLSYRKRRLLRNLTSVTPDTHTKHSASTPTYPVCKQTSPIYFRPCPFPCPEPEPPCLAFAIASLQAPQTVSSVKVSLRTLGPKHCLSGSVRAK